MKILSLIAFLSAAASPTPDPYFKFGERIGQNIAYIAIALFFGIGIFYALYEAIFKRKKTD